MRRVAALCVFLCAGLAVRDAAADRVALLPARGGNTPEESAALGKMVETSIASLGHTLVPADEVGRAAASAPAGLPTPEALRAIGDSLGADWVVVPLMDPAVTTFRAEIGASFVKAGRYESVAREVARSAANAQVNEMVVVLLRAEGVGTAALPWEDKGPPRPTPPPPKEKPDPKVTITPPVAPAQDPSVPEGKTRLSYLATDEIVTSIYGGDRPFYISGGLGFDVIVVRPEEARGGQASFTGNLRIGGAIPSTGLELFAEVGGHLVGAPAVWFGGGARYMFVPIQGERDAFAFHIGPSLRAHAFVRPGQEIEAGGSTFTTDTQFAPSFIGSVEASLGVLPNFILDAQLGELRWALFDGEDSVVSVGATVGAALRF